jgi:hypothetical protein
MRHAAMLVSFLLVLGSTMLSCDQPAAIGALGGDELSSDVSIASDATSSKDAGEGTIRALERIERIVFDGEDERAETYDIEYADSELRTSVIHRDAEDKVHRADAFFNIDGSLSFVRMRDAGGNTKTVHFVYDSIGNPIERIESLNDVPVEKVVYVYDDQEGDRRKLNLSMWKEGRWVPMEGRVLTLIVNAEQLPVMIESKSPEGNRRVAFEYINDGAAIDHYVDNAVSAEGVESSSSCFVSYRAGKPEALTLRTDEKPGSELRIVAEPGEGAAGETGEVLRACTQEGCADVERRAFTYAFRDTEPFMPPVSIVMPFLGLGSSLAFMEQPGILLGREGIGLPMWLGL